MNNFNDKCPPIFELDENGIPINARYESEEEFFEGNFTLVQTLCHECKELGYCKKGLLTQFPKPNKDEKI